MSQTWKPRVHDRPRSRGKTQSQAWECRLLTHRPELRLWAWPAGLTLDHLPSVPGEAVEVEKAQEAQGPLVSNSRPATFSGRSHALGCRRCGVTASSGRS